jgi:hypothetical protein
MKRIKQLIVVDSVRDFLLPAAIYVAIAIFFLFKLLISSGDTAQQDWGIPLTASAAFRDFSSRLFVWDYNGFGSPGLFWGFPFFTLTNALLAPLGFVGGVEIKVLSVFLVALGGVTAYLLARSFRLGKLSSFLAGLFFMSTPVVFNWLMFGWIFYLLAYDLLPLFILFTKKFIETNDFRYALVNGFVLALATIQPTFILVFPLVGFLFLLFESNGSWSVIRRGFVLSFVSLSIWVLTALSFFSSHFVGETLGFYYGDYFTAIQWQFKHFSTVLNPLRLWGSTMNFQFGTYYPGEILLISFTPVILATLAILLRPHDRRILFFLFSYLFAYLAYYVYSNLDFLVFNLPYGAIFQAPSIFLVPASLGLALLIGYTNDCVSVLWNKFRRVLSSRLFKNVAFVVILLLVVLAGFPWWSGQASGEPIRGSPTKLNLYEMPSGYKDWNNLVKADDNYFVFYVPLKTNIKMLDQDYFSEPYEGVNMGIFTEVNNLPRISRMNTTLLLDELISDNSELAEKWGAYSIKYVVVYTNVNSTYNIDILLDHLYAQKGLMEVATLPGVVVFENEFARPVVYADSDGVEVQIVYHDPTLFRVEVNSSGPFVLVFNQVYSGGWRAWVNGSVLPDLAHFKSADGFNSWQVDYSGNMAIDIYYEPQTTYLISIIISVVVVVATATYLVVASIERQRKLVMARKL